MLYSFCAQTWQFDLVYFLVAFYQALHFFFLLYAFSFNLIYDPRNVLLVCVTKLFLFHELLPLKTVQKLFFFLVRLTIKQSRNSILNNLWKFILYGLQSHGHLIKFSRHHIQELFYLFAEFLSDFLWIFGIHNFPCTDDIFPAAIEQQEYKLGMEPFITEHIFCQDRIDNLIVNGFRYPAF